MKGVYEVSYTWKINKRGWLILLPGLDASDIYIASKCVGERRS